METCSCYNHGMFIRTSPNHQHKTSRPIRLTKRDKRILETIYAFDGMMSRKQIDELFFSGKGRTQPRQRMNALFNHGYLKKPMAQELHRVPLGEVIYWLDHKGAEAVAAAHGEFMTRFSWRRKPRWSLIEHDLKVNEFRMAVAQSCSNSPLLTLHCWVSEGEFQAKPDKVTFQSSKSGTKSRQVIPDGFFTIRRPDQHKPGQVEEFAFLLEIDMATESNPRFAREKVQAGLAYLNSKAYRERFGINYGAYLVVTTGEQRLAHLKYASERAGGHGLFYLTTFDDISSETVLAKPIWRLAGTTKNVTIIPNSNVISLRH